MLRVVPRRAHGHTAGEDPARQAESLGPADLRAPLPPAGPRGHPWSPGAPPGAPLGAGQELQGKQLTPSPARRAAFPAGTRKAWGVTTRQDAS